MLDKPYRIIVGKLLYVSLPTRPDIAAAVSIASRFVADPGIGHWRGVQQILRYLRGTDGLGICISVQGTLNLIGFSDSDWAGDIATRQSTSGHIFQINGSSVNWKSKRQASVALSSTEAEYMALSEAAKELICLSYLLKDLGMNGDSIIMKEDNQGCIALARNPGDHPRTKHIAIRFHFIRSHVDSGLMDLQYIPTDENVADIMTKPFGRVKFIQLRGMLNLRDSELFVEYDMPKDTSSAN